MKYRHYVIALLVCLGITFWLGRPLVGNLATRTSTGSEEYLVSFIISWVRQSVTHDITQLVNVPFMYPTPNTLAFSDYFISQGVISVPLYWLTGNPTAAYNLLVMLALVFNPFSFYVLAQRLTKNSYASLAAAMLFGFSVGRIDIIEHLQVFSMYWVCFGLAALVASLETRQLKYALLGALLFLAQGLDTVFMTFVFAASASSIVMMYQLKHKLPPATLMRFLWPWLVSASLVAVAYIPYLSVAREYAYTRTLKDAYAGSAYWADYIYPSGNSTLRPLAQAIWYKQPWTAYLGAVLTVLAIVSICFFWKRQKSWHVWSALTMAMTGLILSFGPYFQIVRQKHLGGIRIPLPYLALYYLIPGFKSMRVPQRWSHLAILGACILIALMMAAVMKWIKRHSINRLLVGGLILLVVLELRQPFFTVRTPARDPLFALLQTHPPGVVLELPASSYPLPQPQVEIGRLFQHTFLLNSGHRFINGYSGYAAPWWTLRLMRLIISPATFATAMNDFKPDYVVVEKDNWNELATAVGSDFNADRVLSELRQMPYEVIYEHDGTYLFREKW